MHSPLATASLAVLLVAGAAGVSRESGAQSLRGSRASVDRMYDQARAERLTFHETSRTVRSAASKGKLVRLASSNDVTLHAVGFPYVTSATRTFVQRLGAQYRRACGERMVVTSATRPASRQPANSVDRSVHPTGMAIDLRKPSGRCLTWLRTTLLDLEDAGVIEATEEFRPPHFHVAVFQTAYVQYAGGTRATDDPAEAAPRASTATTGTTVAAADAPPAPRAAARSTRGTARSAGRVTYRVRPGDTLWGIARSRDTTVERLVAANGLRGQKIRPGQTLVIPTRGR